VETPVDVVALLVAYLLSRIEVTGLVGQRIHPYVLLPPYPVLPLVSLDRVGGTREGLDNHLDRPLVRFDVWATSQNAQAAQDIVAAVRAVLSHVPFAGAYAGGVVTGAQEITGPQSIPDRVEGRVRFTWTVQLYTHP